MTDSKYNVTIPTLTDFKSHIACQFACPVHTDARGYVTAVGRGDYERAYLIARETNPFASTCGWVCSAPCEASCTRGNIDEPVAIRALKRFANNRYGIYHENPDKKVDSTGWDIYPRRENDIDLGNSSLPNNQNVLGAIYRQGKKTGKRIAVVGAGPAGLSCAHDLALRGYEVDIYETSSVAGGMLRLGIPEYRLPRELLDLEIEVILALGPKIHFNKALGQDFSLADLRSEHDAVFLAFGTHVSRRMNIEGEQLDGVLRSTEFLLNANLEGYNMDLGRKICVIGGGDVAVDVARTATRLTTSTAMGEFVESEEYESALDVARTAVRLGEAPEVHCLVRRTMRATLDEIEQAEEEGVLIHLNHVTRRIVGEGGRVTGVETIESIAGVDEFGNFMPTFIEGTEKIWECDSVVMAVGHIGDTSWIKPEDGLETDKWNDLVVDRKTLSTSAEGVYAGGDIAFGPRLIIDAVAEGKIGALSIHSYLQKNKPLLTHKGYFTTIEKRDYPDKGPIRNYLRWSREQPPTLDVDRRVGVAYVELEYTEENAQKQGDRCLICSFNPIFDGELCILCNRCVDVCPTNCLKLVSIDELAGDEETVAVIENHKRERQVESAMLFDPKLCIRCGLCAEYCPTDAVVMESFSFTEEITFE